MALLSVLTIVEPENEDIKELYDRIDYDRDDQCRAIHRDALAPIEPLTGTIAYFAGAPVPYYYPANLVLYSHVRTPWTARGTLRMIS